MAAAALAALAGGAGADERDVEALKGVTTRTLMVEDVPACDALPGTSAGRNFEVGSEAVALQVEFERGTARLRPDAMRRLDRLAATLRDPALAQARFVLAGHTDASGSDVINVPLSCARAKAVRDYLGQRHGVAAERLHVEGFGARRPLDAGHPMQAANRRVEVRRWIVPGEPR
jgi:outer membrane protein OmpA-like peptidoglycan-associated protein